MAMRLPYGDRMLAKLGRRLTRLVTGGQSVDRQPERRRPNPSAVVDCALYTGGRRQPGTLHFADAYARVRRRDTYVWLGLHDPCPALMTDVGRAFGLHELTVAHAVAEGHRPSVERHGDVTVFVMRTARYVEHAELTETSEVVDTGDVTVLLGDRFVITVRHGSAGALADVRARLEQQPALLEQGPWSVAYAVCARMVDLYLEVADHLETDLEDVEATVFSRDRAPDIQQIYQLKRELVEFKRAVTPLQPQLHALVLDDREALPVPLQRYFDDVSGRLSRAVERVHGFDELLNSVLQARLTQVTIDQNNDMRKIAAWAAIAAVPTVMAGVYGMNFENMPELKWEYGYYGLLLVMLTVTVTLHRLFRRSGWL
jgi:magnesium transporter